MKPVVAAGSGPRLSLVGKPLVAAQGSVESLVPRDQWDRPRIIPPGGHVEKCKSRIGDLCTCPGYIRTTTIAETVEDHYGLERWKQRITIEGLVSRPDLILAAQVATGDSKEMTKILETAFDAGGGNVASTRGTMMHNLTERRDLGLPDPPGLPPNVVAMLDAYSEAMADNFEVLDTETFVVCDPIKVGGTYDKRLRYIGKSRPELQGKVLIGDTKTGQSLEYMHLKTCAQVSIYASSKKYELDGDRYSLECDKDKGILIWLPWVDDASDAECDLRTLDLVTGRAVVKHALKTREFRAMKHGQTLARL